MDGKIPVPKNILEYPMDGGTRVVCRWNRETSALGYLLFFGCAMILAFLFIAIRGENWNFADMLWELWSHPYQLLTVIVITLAVGFGLLAKFINRVEIRITNSDVVVGIQPLSWRGSRSVRRSDITRLYIDEQSKIDSYGHVTKNFELHFVDPNGAHSSLVRFLRVHEALYLRRRLGEILAIDDLSVGGSACA